MKVKAKWAVKVDGVWRRSGDVFDVENTAGLEGAVEVIEAPKAARAEKPKPAEEPPVQAEPAQEPEAAEKPRTATRTRKTAKKD